MFNQNNPLLQLLHLELEKRVRRQQTQPANDSNFRINLQPEED